MDKLWKVLKKGIPMRRLLQSFKQGIRVSAGGSMVWGKVTNLQKKYQQGFLNNKIYDENGRYYKCFLNPESR